MDLLLDTALSRNFLPWDKFLALHSCAHSLGAQKSLSVSACMRILGFMIASFKAVLCFLFPSIPLQLNILAVLEKWTVFALSRASASQEGGVVEGYHDGCQLVGLECNLGHPCGAADVIVGVGFPSTF